MNSTKPSLPFTLTNELSIELFAQTSIYIPMDCTITYASIVVDHRSHKDDLNRVGITTRRNLLEYLGELTTQTVNLTTTKVMGNSVISTPNARYVCADVKNVYLCSLLERYKYMRMPISLIPPKSINVYDLVLKVKTSMSQ